MFACAPRLRSPPHDAAGTAASHPGCVVVLSPAEAKVDALPYRLRGTLLVVSGCCHVAAPVVIQVCYEPTKRRRKTFFKASKKEGTTCLFLCGKGKSKTTRRGVLKAAPASWLAVSQRDTALCAQREPSGTFIAICPKVPELQSAVHTSSRHRYVFIMKLHLFFSFPPLQQKARRQAGR